MTKFALLIPFIIRKMVTIWYRPYIWWRYINIFLIWKQGEESLKLFLEKINSIHPTIKFTADCSYSSVNFLDVKVILRDGQIITDLYVKPTDIHQYLLSSSCHPYHCKVSLTAKFWVLIESALIMPFLIRDVTN